jgi:hypothetical protein
MTRKTLHNVKPCRYAVAANGVWTGETRTMTTLSLRAGATVGDEGAGELELGSWVGAFSAVPSCVRLHERG